MTDHVDPNPNSGRVPQPGGFAMPVPVVSLATEQDEAAADLVMDVGVLVEAPAEEVEAEAPKKRGRPRKVTVEDDAVESEDDADSDSEGMES